MEILEGIAVSPGVAIGGALVIDNEGFLIPRSFVLRGAAEDEVQRFDRAIVAASQEILRTQNSMTEQLGEKVGAIFAAHLQILQDPRLRHEVEAAIREHGYSAEYAVTVTLGGYAKLFQQSANPVLAERAHDILDLERGLLRHLTGRPQDELGQLSSAVVLLAHNLTPGETAKLKPEFVLGFVTELGGVGGHTAIVARGLGIPAVVGIGRFLTRVTGREQVIVDGNRGLVILDPDEDTSARYRREVQHQKAAAAELEPLWNLPAETRDGVRILLTANIEFPKEAGACLRLGADGIGLYRTEFLYTSRREQPSEEDHFQAYAEVARAMQGRPVVIRTLDLGADKMGLAQADPEDEPNPFLGLRSIRLSLRHPDVFVPQLRAVLRASALGDVRVMFPLITTLPELRLAKEVLAQSMTDLENRGVPFRREIPVGMMVESPAAAILIDRFVKEVSFISIGTNDLVQYTLAVDRSNPCVANLFQTADPAVLRLIAASLRAAQQAGVKASLCGQMSGHAVYTMLLLGMGLRELSVPPNAIPEIKRVCRSVTVAECEAVAARALTLDSASEVETFLREEYQKLCF